MRRRSRRNRRRGTPQVEQRPHDNQRQWWHDRLQSGVLGSIPAQQRVHQSQLSVTARPSLSLLSDRRQTGPEETGGEYGNDTQRESAETKCFQSDPSASSQSVAWTHTSVDPVPGQRRHTKLLPQPHQEVQTSSQRCEVASTNAAQTERRSGVWWTP